MPRSRIGKRDKEVRVDRARIPADIGGYRWVWPTKWLRWAKIDGSCLSLVCSTARKDAPDEHGLRLAVVVEDHAPVTDAQPETLAAREPSHVERAILGEETIEAGENALAYGRIKAAQILLGAARKAQAAAHPA
ncbi:MAG: hypothetical protein JWN10_2514 [Solirubrobacterales bacterium]|nr:hypothetical protein [Solirubrobacterales bacterium]